MTETKLTKDEINAKMRELKDWVHQSPGVPENFDMLLKMYPFEDFKNAKEFVDKVSEIAEASGHYPGINFTVSYVQVLVWTPDLNGLTEKDFKLAKEIDELDQPAMEKENFIG